MATVPTGLQACIKVLQVHMLRRGGGPPWLQPNSNLEFRFALLYPFQFLVAVYLVNYFHYSGHCAHRVANLRKRAANAPARRKWVATLVATQQYPKFKISLTLSI